MKSEWWPLRSGVGTFCSWHVTPRIIGWCFLLFWALLNCDSAVFPALCSGYPWSFSGVLFRAPKGGCFDQGVVRKNFILWFLWFSWFLEILEFIGVKRGLFSKFHLVGSRGFVCEKRTTGSLFLNNPLPALRVFSVIFLIWPSALL